MEITKGMLVVVKDPCQVCEATGRTLRQDRDGISPHACMNCGGARFIESEIALVDFVAMVKKSLEKA